MSQTRIKLLNVKRCFALKKINLKSKYLKNFLLHDNSSQFPIMSKSETYFGIIRQLLSTHPQKKFFKCLAKKFYFSISKHEAT